jgi:hypothetical protein
MKESGDYGIKYVTVLAEVIGKPAEGVPQPREVFLPPGEKVEKVGVLSEELDHI